MKTEITYKKDKNGCLIFPENPGDKVRKQYLWNKDRTALEEVGEVDIQKEIDAAAVGQSAAEQIKRIYQGDLSPFADGEPQYGDVSGVPDTYGEVVKAKEDLDAKVEELKAADQENKKKLAAAQEKLKADYDAYLKSKAEVEKIKGE